MGKKCSRCGGRGKVRVTNMVKQKDGSYKQVQSWVSCPYC